MPNGNLHDGPYSDVVFWQRRVFSVEMDTLLAEIATLSDAGLESLSEDLAYRLLMADPSFGDEITPEVLAALESDVQALRDQRLAEAHARGLDPEARLAPIRALVRERWEMAADG